MGDAKRKRDHVRELLQMLLIAIKVLLAPMLVAACSFATQRWGAAVGGALLGLPLTSGAVSVLLFVQQGRQFALQAARGTLLGLAATAVFCSVYALVAQRHSWVRSLAAAYAVCIVTAILLAEIHPGIAASVVLVLAVIVALVSITGTPSAEPAEVSSSKRGLMLRMAIAGLAVFAITTSAGALGASVSGMLAPLPIVAAVMAGYAHRRGDRDVANDLMRGALLGSCGGAAFFSVVGLMVGWAAAPATYALASGIALASTGAVTKAAARIGKREAIV